ncbi:SHUGOSHIN 2 isoform X1 [Malania oleifera]|uniref:SHUGOSHIN 2 isoform X1 n=1 Tax=Malania oleifera TaxID=397392 RepID=UPI0025AE1052|nr:SHUGOSHIN 2 isoform X1 [Malania oleifera]
MDGSFSSNAENGGVGDNPKIDKIAKRFSYGNGTRKKLADISNLPQQSQPSCQVEKLQCTKEYIDQLHKENMALMKLLADRNKIIELSGLELQKLRIALQKVQQQNLQLAQANSQMLAELNSGKDRLKALQHELGCKNGLLKARALELGGKAKRKRCRDSSNQVGAIKCVKTEGMLQVDKDDNISCNLDRKEQHRDQSMGASTTIQVQAKEKADNKRTCSRRQSTRFKSGEPELTEDLFEIDDAKFPVSPLRDDPMQENGSTSSSSLGKKKDKEGNVTPRYEAQEFRRSSIGRPSRRAAERVQSYKEVPLNVKMRRSESFE